MANNINAAIDCGEMLTIAESAQLYATLLAELAEGHIVAVDLSRVQRIDVAGIQVLLGFSREVALQGQSVDWGTPSETFLKSVAMLGLEAEMGLQTHSGNNGE